MTENLQIHQWLPNQSSLARRGMRTVRLRSVEEKGSLNDRMQIREPHLPLIGVKRSNSVDDHEAQAASFSGAFQLLQLQIQDPR
jgi:hypothetical protein